ncbi:hypothetical protein BCV44_21900 [Vibrio cyclitrophicus]|uniref:hypothetical protein n=1 Tax=Vibrio cyclitrophicus TaxID=47951 RepID=UPI000C817226|nr:hypothetical protein [Vibrio cyclitrophicus]PME10751.1 hypothetical protein BCV44_21900 [Vibrio cyclitrophicus]
MKNIHLLALSASLMMGCSSDSSGDENITVPPVDREPPVDIHPPIDGDIPVTPPPSIPVLPELPIEVQPPFDREPPIDSEAPCSEDCGGTVKPPVDDDIDIEDGIDPEEPSWWMGLKLSALVEDERDVLIQHENTREWIATFTREYIPGGGGSGPAGPCRKNLLPIGGKYINYDLTDYGYNLIDTHEVFQEDPGPQFGGTYTVFGVVDRYKPIDSVRLTVNTHTGYVTHVEPCY